MTSAVRLPGLADGVHDAQACFRLLLAAFAAPATVQDMPVDLEPPPALCVAAALTLLTLADFDTPLWLAGAQPRSAENEGAIMPPMLAAIRAYLAFHCGSGFAEEAGEAAFVLLLEPAALDLSQYRQGSAAYPDRSATVVVQVDSLTRGPARTFRGPGIRTQQGLHVAGLPPDFDAQWRRNQAGFPTGVDLILCCGRQLAVLPRTACLDVDAPV